MLPEREVLSRVFAGVERYRLSPADLEDSLHHLYVPALTTPPFLFLIPLGLSQSQSKGMMRRNADNTNKEKNQTILTQNIG